MSKSSIHISVIKAGSEAHNEREHPMEHVYPELIQNNESLILKSVSEARNDIEIKCKELSGRKLQKNAEPIREGVVNIKPETTMQDLQNLASRLNEEFKISCFQIHIHRDEGKSQKELNYHAHMLFDYQDPIKGTVIKPDKQMLAQIQTITAEVLGMERGKSSDLKHLNAIQYKNQVKAKELAHLEAISATLGDKADQYIKKNLIGGLDTAKTSENIQSLILRNIKLEEEAKKVPQLEKQITDSNTSKSLLERYIGHLLFQKEKNVSFNVDFEKELKENPNVKTVINKLQKDYQKLMEKQEGKYVIEEEKVVEKGIKR